MVDAQLTIRSWFSGDRLWLRKPPSVREEAHTWPGYELFYVQNTGLSHEQLKDMTEDAFETTMKALGGKSCPPIANNLSHLRTPFTNRVNARIIEIYNPDLRLILRFQIHLSN